MAGKKRAPHRQTHQRPEGVGSYSKTPKPKPLPAPPPSPPQQPRIPVSSEAFWIYGLHAVRAALTNPRRKVRRAMLTERATAELRTVLSGISQETASPESIGRLLGQGSVHQGAAILCEPLPERDLEEVLSTVPEGRRVVAVLDQITDPHNEGAILRSAAAFGVAAVVVQNRHAAPESGALAKAASGALDRIPRVAVVNIARALEDLGRLGFWRVALAGDGDGPLMESFRTGDVALAFGAEGAGLRRLVRERCDASAFIQTDGASLNVSNAAAIAFYELRRAS